MKVRVLIYCTRKELYSILKGEFPEYNEGDINYICKNISDSLLEKESKFGLYADVFKEASFNYSERAKNLIPLSSFGDAENIAIMLEINITESETIIVSRKVFPTILYNLNETELKYNIRINRIKDLHAYEGLEIVALLNNGINERNILGATSYTELNK